MYVLSQESNYFTAMNPTESDVTIYLLMSSICLVLRKEMASLIMEALSSDVTVVEGKGRSDARS